jgi:hypothetical protein
MSTSKNPGWTARLAQWLPLLPPIMALLYVHRGWIIAPWRVVAGALNHLGWLEGTQHWYWHIAHDLFLGINPFKNNWQAFPQGDYHLLLQGNFGDALLASPLQWLVSFPLSYNLTVLLFTAINVYGLYRLARVFTEHRLVASLAACLVIIHPYFVALVEHGRLTQYLVGWAFLALAEAARVMRNPSRPIRRLVFFWAATFVSFWFYGIFLSCFLAIWVLVATRGRSWSQKKPFAKALGWTFAWSIPFGLPLAIEAFSGSGIYGVAFFSLPSAGPRWASSPLPLDFVTLTPSELGAVMIPATLLIGAGIALFGGWRNHSRPEWNLAALGLAAAGAAILALGPFYTVCEDGGPNLLVPLPWCLLYAIVPFFSRLSYPSLVFPFLLAGVLGLALRAIAETVLFSPSRLGQRWLPSIVLVLVLAELLLRAPASLTSAPYEVPEPYRWLAAQEEADAILEYPFGYTDCAWLYQPVHRKCLMGTEGRFDDIVDSTLLQDLFESSNALKKLVAVQRGGEFPALPTHELEVLYREGFDYLVFRPIQCGQQDRFTPEWKASTRDWLEAELGPPVSEADGISVFELPGSGEQKRACGDSD